MQQNHKFFNYTCKQKLRAGANNNVWAEPSRAGPSRAETSRAEPSRPSQAVAKLWPSRGGPGPQTNFLFASEWGGGGIKITCWQIVFSHIFTLINKGSRTVQIRVVIYPCVKHRVQEFPLCLHTQHTWVMTTLISTLPGPIISVSTCSSYGGCGRLRFK